MIAKFSPVFRRRIKKVSKDVKSRFKIRLNLFLEDPFNQLLNNHQLAGKYLGYRSINITGDWRAVYRLIDEDTAYFTEIGTHSKLYA
jgi:addiction module RelE/StbE family toxin